MRAFPAAASATAALALMALAGFAHAIPPEPASAPKGAHVAAAPPPATVPASTIPGITPNGNSNAPYDISSEGMEVLQPQRLVIFKGNVEVTQDTARLRTPELHVFYKPKAPGAAAGPAPAGALGMDAGGMDHMEASGPVYYITPTQNARGDAMTYYADPDVITMTGHVILVQGKSVAKGDKLVMDRKTGQSNLISNAPLAPTGRVRVILYPQQQQPGAPAAAPKPAH